jgi:uncharacterized membrane protein
MDIHTSDFSLFDALKDMSFTEFVTLKLIKFLYILGLLGIGLVMLTVILGGFSQGFLGGLGAIVVSAIGALFAVLLLRVYLEIVAVVFRVASNTAQIAENTSRAQS